MSEKSLQPPQLIMFDWHGTLVDTLDAMYASIEEMLSRLEELSLLEHIVSEERATTSEDEKLIRYIRIFRHLHPKVLSERRISRTDIFDALFAGNLPAKDIAHKAYNEIYRKHYGAVSPYQGGIFEYIRYFKALGVKVGVLTNRSREFLMDELTVVDNGRWRDIFDIIMGGDEAPRYKPEPEGLLEACERLGVKADGRVWYVGDSITDMITARAAGVTSVFYNGACWEDDWFHHMFAIESANHLRPDHIVSDFDGLTDLVDACIDISCESKAELKIPRPERQPPLGPPPAREEPDWHPAVVTLEKPKVIIFDWHATLVDTLDAMYHAVDDMLKELVSLGLLTSLAPPSSAKSPDDLKLVEYVRENLSLHPKVKLDRKISRTDIFEVLFGDNQAAKQIAHKAFTRHYRNYFGTALPFEPQVRAVLEGLKSLGYPLGVITNRDREFFIHELNIIEGTGWGHLFEVEICGDDTEKRKPHTDQLELACKQLGADLDASVWYVGDSTTDVIASKTANITSVFFNGAAWDLPWLNKIFPGNERYPHKPDVVVNDFSEFWALILSCRKNGKSSLQK